MQLPKGTLSNANTLHRTHKSRAANIQAVRDYQDGDISIGIQDIDTSYASQSK